MIGSRSLPFSIEERAPTYVKDRVSSLFRFDQIRIMQLLEVVQYTVIYFVLGFFLGATLDMLFPRFNEKEDIERVTLEVLGQLIVFVVFIFYIRKIVKLVPFLFVLGGPAGKKFIPYKTTEYEGEITIGLVVIASQFNLIKKIDLLSREFYRALMGLEKRTAALI